MKNEQNFSGYFFAVLAYLIWGLSPLFWKQLDQQPAFRLLIYRIFWSLLFVWLYLAILKKKICFTNLKKEWLRILISCLLLSGNWIIYIFAVNSGFLQDASLGYYINPLISVFLGMFFLKEKLKPAEWAALTCAMAGVVYLTIHVGRFPWISLALAFSFGFYGLLKKRSALTAVPGLAMELLFVLPFLLGYILLQPGGPGAMVKDIAGYTPGTILLIIFTGPLTVIPLVLFGLAVARIKLSAVGFLQFLAPTLMLVISIIVFKEDFPVSKLPGFLLVWLALGIYIGLRFKRE